jgi:hypothetical protein
MGGVQGECQVVADWHDESEEQLPRKKTGIVKAG